MRAHKLSPGIKAHRTMQYNKVLNTLRALHGALTCETEDFAELTVRYGLDVSKALVDAKVAIGQAERYE